MEISKEYTEYINNKLKNVKISKNIIFITSGGTSIPLEKNTVRSLENFSTGKRGSKMAEYFLKNDYIVIFFSRNNSLKPFMNDINLYDIFNQYDENKLKKHIEIYKKYEENLIIINFENLFEYLNGWELIWKKINTIEFKIPIILAAAVSDYYIPLKELNEHKIQNDSNQLTLNLQKSPKILKNIKENYNIIWITFKLETDIKILNDKIQNNFIKTNSDIIVGNILQTRYNELYVYKSKTELLKINKGNEFIEKDLVNYLINIIKNY